MGEEVVYRALDHITSGVEDIIGYHGRHWWIQKLREINAKYINPIFTRNAIKTYDEEIIRIFNRMAIKELIFHSFTLHLYCRPMIVSNRAMMHGMESD